MFSKKGPEAVPTQHKFCTTDFALDGGLNLRKKKKIALSLKQHLFLHSIYVKMEAQGFLDLFLDAAPSLKGEAFLVTVGAFVLTVKLLCLQSLKALIRCTFPL